MTWTADALATTTRLWGEGYSATEIAKAVKARHGISKSRNAIIGKIHRAGLAGRTTPSRPPASLRATANKRRNPPQRSQKRSQPLPPEPPAPCEPLNIPLASLESNQCHAVTDATRWAQRYCGQPVAFGCSYCSGHFAQFRIFTAKKGKAQ